MNRICLLFLIAIGIFVVLSNKKENFTNKKYADADLKNKTWSTEKIGWIENSRYNLNDGKYPPCFNLSNNAKEIFDLLESNQLIVKHKVLLEVISMILCQYKYLSSKLCIDTMIQNRIQDLTALGYQRYDNRYRDLLKNIIGNYLYENSSPLFLEFLLRSLTLIEEQIIKMKVDIANNKLEKIRLLISNFYNEYFSLIAKGC